MKQLYTLEEIHRYADEVRQTNTDMWDAINKHDVDQKNQIQNRLHVMHEVLTRMHENLEKHGPYRPGLLGRWLAARETRKLGVGYYKAFFPPVDKFENFVHGPSTYGTTLDSRGKQHSKNIKENPDGTLSPAKPKNDSGMRI